MAKRNTSKYAYPEISFLKLGKLWECIIRDAQSGMSIQKVIHFRLMQAYGLVGSTQQAPLASGTPVSTSVPAQSQISPVPSLPSEDFASEIDPDQIEEGASLFPMDFT